MMGAATMLRRGTAQSGRASAESSEGFVLRSSPSHVGPAAWSTSPYAMGAPLEVASVWSPSPIGNRATFRRRGSTPPLPPRVRDITNTLESNPVRDRARLLTEAQLRLWGSIPLLSSTRPSPLGRLGPCRLAWPRTPDSQFGNGGSNPPRDTTALLLAE